jgi:hypothetical protein
VKHRKQRSFLGFRFHHSIAAAVVLALFVLLTMSMAQAQTFQVIHSFSGGADGATPVAGLSIDRAGNLYGTASAGGLVLNNCPSQGCGTAFRLQPAGEGWFLLPLYSFKGGSDGFAPGARMTFGANGLLYGTTEEGGGNTCYNYTCGIAFQLAPPPTACKNAICSWDETIIYRFAPTPAPGNPFPGPMVFDQAGNLYGYASQGAYSFGAVYELSPGSGSWTETSLFNWPDGGAESGVVFGADGNLYGPNDAEGYGGVYQMTRSGSGWTVRQLFSILDVEADGFETDGGVVLDNAGNVYGSTTGYGPNGGGTIFELSAGTWNFNLLYGFSGNGGPEESLSMDAAGNIYGTTNADGAHNKGNVFKLSPSANGWIYTDLYDFTGGSDGGYPISNVVLDAQGNLYGTTSTGGIGSCTTRNGNGCGVVWKITP